MDHDAVDARLQRVERFLDANAPGWRDESKWRKMRGDDGGDRTDSGWMPERREGELEIDHDKTKADRIALGLDRPEEPKTGKEAGEEIEKRNGLLASLEAYRGKPGFMPPDEDASIADLEAAPELARDSNKGGGVTRKPGNATAGSEPAVALTGEAAEKLAETANDPAKAERAETQRAQKEAGEAAGGIKPEAVRPQG